MKLRRLVLAVAAVCVGGAEIHAAEFEDDPFLCVVPITGSEPLEADLNSVTRMTTDVEMLPNFPLPLIRAATSTNAPRRETINLTIDKERSFTAFPLPVPRMPTQWSTIATWDPVGERVLAAGYGSLLAARPGETEFEPVIEWEGHRPELAVAYLPRFGRVFVGGEQAGWLDGDEIEPLDAAAGIGRVSRILDVPGFDATLLLVRRGEDNHALYTLNDDASLTRLVSPELSRWDFVSRVDYVPSLGQLLVKTMHKAYLVEPVEEGGTMSAGRITRIDTGSDDEMIWVDTGTGRLLAHHRPRWFGYFGKRGLDVYDRGEFRAVAGDDLSGVRYLFREPVPSREQMIVEGGDVLYAFDGEALTPLDATHSSRIGRPRGTRYLESVDQVLFTAGDGFVTPYRLERDGSVHALPIPLVEETGPFECADLPASELGLVSAPAGLYSIAADGTVRRIPGGEAPGAVYNAFAGVVPVRREMIVRGNERLYLVADRRFSGGCPNIEASAE